MQSWLLIFFTTIFCLCSITAQAEDTISIHGKLLMLDDKTPHVAVPVEAIHNGETVDLVLSDVVLPDGRGPDLVDEFINQQPDLAAVLITGYTDERSDRERVREAGLMLLQKPIPMSVLLEQVHNALTRQGETS